MPFASKEEEMRSLRERQRARRFRALAAGAAVALTTACATQAKSVCEAAVPSVGVVVAEHRDIPLEATYTGRVDAFHRRTIQA